MKIPHKVQKLYDEMKPQLSLLRAEVDGLLLPAINNNEWFYRSRLKNIASFYQKLEASPSYYEGKFDDFFGCEIVVDSRSQITSAVELIEKYFTIVYQRPKNKDETNLNPESFRFSDLRMYLKRKVVLGMPEKDYQQLLFELQIKTIFSYSWAKATHDLVYKTKDISWARERVAFQIKAMLEQSEYAISNIENTNDTFFPNHPVFSSLKKIATLFEERWESDLLPTDLKRCVNNIISLAENLNIKPGEAYNLLESAITPDFIKKHRNISPFFASLVIFEGHSSGFVTTKNMKIRNKFLVVDEVVEYLKSDYIKNLRDNGFIYELIS